MDSGLVAASFLSWTRLSWTSPSWTSLSWTSLRWTTEPDAARAWTSLSWTLSLTGIENVTGSPPMQCQYNPLQCSASTMHWRTELDDTGLGAT